MEMKAARRVGQIGSWIFSALFIMFAICAPSRAAERIGIVLMHGEAGAPGRVIVGLTDALEKAGYLVARPDMCWSARRSYEARFTDCLALASDCQTTPIAWRLRAASRTVSDAGRVVQPSMRLALSDEKRRTFPSSKRRPRMTGSTQ